MFERKNSWCKWQSDIATGKQTYKKKLNLPVAIMNEIKPVFQNLSDVTMLEKCLHGWNDSKLMSHSANSYGIAVRKTYLLKKK